MLVKDIMTRNVISVPSNTPVGEAQKIMREHNFRRLPVVDDGRVVGIVNDRRLEQVKPQTQTPLLWQITYLISHTTVKDVMYTDPVMVRPEDTVEYAVARAQARKVGSLLVMEGDKLVGICTTNDFFYNIVNPTLGLGEAGIRILVVTDNIGPSAQEIVTCINKLGIEIIVLWAVPAGSDGKKNIILHLVTEKTGEIIQALQKLNCTATILGR